MEWVFFVLLPHDTTVPLGSVLLLLLKRTEPAFLAAVMAAAKLRVVSGCYTCLGHVKCGFVVALA